jgi:transcriptional regulator with XRE-family HTH domain
MKFGVILRKMRTERGLTQTALAEAAGLHRVALANLEYGKREPMWETVQALAGALGVSCDEFRDRPKRKKRKR